MQMGKDTLQAHVPRGTSSIIPHSPATCESEATSIAVWSVKLRRAAGEPRHLNNLERIGVDIYPFPGPDWRHRLVSAVQDTEV